MQDNPELVLPGMPLFPRAVCGEPGCGKHLRCDNVSGLCGPHRVTGTSRGTVPCAELRCGALLRPGNVTGYCRDHQASARPPYMEAGESHGRWVTLEAAATAASKALCRCACGTVRPVQAQSLRRGLSQSCGCLVGTFHGLSKHPARDCWYAMITRCTKPSATGYANYGGRGIKVCDRWSGPDGIANFIADM